MAKYTYKVTVDHYVTFTDSDVEDSGDFEGSDPEEFAQSRWGGEYETDFDRISVELYEYDTEEDES